MEARKLKKVVIKEELFTLTGDMFESILLGQLIYWQDKVNDFDKFIDEEQKRCEYNKLSFNMEKSNGWMFKKASELKDECMLNISEQTIRKYLQKLTDKGFINSRINPKYKWDRTIQYRVNINFVIDSIKQLGYDGLSGWKYTTSKNKTSNLENGDSLDNNRDSKESNGAAIPYTTNINYNTDITNKKEDTNVSKKEDKKKLTFSEDVEYLYSLYPSKCPKRNMSTGKSSNDKEKIKRLLTTMPKEELEFTIKSYVEECVRNDVFLKNFSTLLNNLPDMGYLKEQPIIKAQTGKYR